MEKEEQIQKLKEENKQLKEKQEKGIGKLIKTCL